MSKVQKAQIIILISVFAVSLIYSLTNQIPPMVDAKKYDNFALHLSQGGEYKADALKFTGPGYPLFLAGIYSLFGHQYEIVWIIQALIHALTALLVAKTAQLLFNQNENKNLISLIAMGLYGFYPDLIQSTAILMSETLYLSLIVCATYFGLKLSEQSSLKFNLLFPFLLGLAVIVRPVALVLFLFVIIYWLYQKRFKNFIFTIVIVILLISPFSYFFSKKTGDFTLLSNAGQYDLWLGNNPYANGEIIVIPEEAETFKGLQSEKEVNKKALQEVSRFIREEPLNWLKLQLIKTSKYFSLIRPYGFWFYLSKFQQLLIVIPSAAFLFLAFIGGISGLALALRNYKNRLHSLFAIMAAAAPLSIIPIIVEPRFHFQIYPFLMVYAAYFLIRLSEWKLMPKIEKKIVALVMIILMGNSFIDVWREKDLIQSKLNFYRNSDSQEFLKADK